MNYLREIWRELGRSIFVGERHDKNLRGIGVGAMLIVVMNLITGSLNFVDGLYAAAISSLVLIVASSIILFFALVKKDRTIAVTIATVMMVVIYSYDVIAVTGPIMPLWTLLFPWAFAYLASVKHGIFLSLFFSLLYLVLFYTPAQSIVEGKYPDFILQRFPIIFLANAFLSIYVMVQYHKNTLHQMDYAEQLLEAKDAADKANAAKSEFLANMSHEIRTPINAVLGMNEMILRESEQRGAPETSLANIRTYAENIDSAGNNLLSIINDILDFSKIESGKMEITDADYQLSSVLNDVSNMISFKAKDKELDFRVDVDPALPDELCGDEVRVRQIMVNLLSNAVKYTHEGSVALCVRKQESSAVEAGGTIHLVIEVRDTGIGIRSEDVDKLFAKFERVDLRQNSTIEGSGLGLAITRNLLEMMDGGIEVQSVYGEGSVFTATLPQKVASAEPIGDFREKFERSMQMQASYTESFRAPDAHILIVDDTRMNLTVAVGLLKKTELQIDTATDGEEALELAASVPYDLILMDQRMPKMDGTEAMRRIRTQEGGANRETPFICLTADAVSGAKKRYLAEGFTDYLSKPIDSKALEELLMKHLPQSKVILVRRNAEKAAQSPQDGFAPLREAGFDPAVGLRYCQGDPELYRSVLREYAQSAAEKSKKLREFLDAANWHDYAILVHALKSSSRTVGAVKLSEQAARLEAAANAGDGKTILTEHDVLLARWETAVHVIRGILPDAEAPDDAEDDALEFLPDEDEAMEFLPE